MFVYKQEFKQKKCSNTNAIDIKNITKKKGIKHSKGFFFLLRVAETSFYFPIFTLTTVSMLFQSLKFNWKRQRLRPLLAIWSCDRRNVFNFNTNWIGKDKLGIGKYGNLKEIDKNNFLLTIGNGFFWQMTNENFITDIKIKSRNLKSK